MCNNFFDVRTFGAVMTTEINSGQVRDPVQLAFAKSIDPIVPLEITITRMAVTHEKDLEKERTMGRKHIVPYGLYRVHGFVSANLAAKTGFSDDDLAKLWQALKMMFEHDHSAARGEMNARRLFVFKHKDALGNTPSHKLFERVDAKRVKGESGTPASGFDDYDSFAAAADKLYQAHGGKSNLSQAKSNAIWVAQCVEAIRTFGLDVNKE